MSDFEKIKHDYEIAYTGLQNEYRKQFETRLLQLVKQNNSLNVPQIKAIYTGMGSCSIEGFSKTESRIWDDFQASGACTVYDEDDIEAEYIPDEIQTEILDILGFANSDDSDWMTTSSMEFDQAGELLKSK